MPNFIRKKKGWCAWGIRDFPNSNKFTCALKQEFLSQKNLTEGTDYEICLEGEVLPKK